MSRTTDLTDREIATALRKNVRTIQRWCAHGQLPGAYHAGRSWRIPRSALNRVQAGALRRSREGPLRALVAEIDGLTQTISQSIDDVRHANRRDCDLLLATLQRLTDAQKELGRAVIDQGRATMEQERSLERESRWAQSPKSDVLEAR